MLNGSEMFAQYFEREIFAILHGYLVWFAGIELKLSSSLKTFFGLKREIYMWVNKHGKALIKRPCMRVYESLYESR